MRKYCLPILILASIVLLVAAGIVLSRLLQGDTEPAAAYDACAPENIAAEVNTVHDLMREFYDASALASWAQSEQLLAIIPSLQEIRRRAEDQEVPSCLETLKDLQLDHMNSVLNTLIAFVGGADPDTLGQGVLLSMSQNEEYRREMARLLGVTYIPPGQSVPTVTPRN